MDLSASNWSGSLCHGGLCVPGTSNWSKYRCASGAMMANEGKARLTGEQEKWPGSHMCMPHSKDRTMEGAGW